MSPYRSSLPKAASRATPTSAPSQPSRGRSASTSNNPTMTFRGPRTLPPLSSLGGGSAAPTPPPTVAAAPIPGGGGGGGGISAPSDIGAGGSVGAPTALTGIDWLNADPIYKAEAGSALQDLKSQLAHILAQRDANYQNMDLSRNEFGRSRQNDLRSIGEDFTGRGLGQSGLYAQGADRVAADYARRGEALDFAQNQIAQQYGQRGSQADLSQLDNITPLSDASQLAGLNPLFSSLGSMGTEQGNLFQQLLAKLRAESAAKSTTPLVNPFGG